MASGPHDFVDLLRQVRELHFMIRVLGQAVCGPQGMQSLKSASEQGQEVSPTELGHILGELGLGEHSSPLASPTQVARSEEVGVLLNKLRSEAADFSLRHKPIHLVGVDSDQQRDAFDAISPLLQDVNIFLKELVSVREDALRGDSRTQDGPSGQPQDVHRSFRENGFLVEDGEEEEDSFLGGNGPRSLREKLRRLELDNEELHALQNELTSEMLSVQSENLVLQSQNSELNEKLQGTRGHGSAHAGAREKDLLEQIQKMDVEMEQLEDSHERLEQENQHLKERLKRLKAELVTLEKENEDLVGQLEGVDQLTTKFKGSSMDLEKELTKREEELENAEEKVGILDTQKRELEAKCLQLEETLQLQAAAHRIQVEEFEQTLDVNGRGTFAGSSNRLGEISRIQGQLMGEHSALSDLTASLDKQCKMLWDHLVSLQRKDQSVLANLESELGKRENTVSELGTMIHDMQAEKARALEFSEMMQREHQKLLTEQQQFFATKQQNAEVISDMQNQLTEMQSEHLRVCNDLKRVKGEAQAATEQLQLEKETFSQEIARLQRRLESSERKLGDREYLEEQMAPEKEKMQRHTRKLADQNRRLNEELSESKLTLNEMNDRLADRNKKWEALCRYMLAVHHILTQVQLQGETEEKRQAISVSAEDFVGQEGKLASGMTELLEGEVLTPLREVLLANHNLRRKNHELTAQHRHLQDGVRNYSQEIETEKQHVAALEEQVEKLCEVEKERDAWARLALQAENTFEHASMDLRGMKTDTELNTKADLRLLAQNRELLDMLASVRRESRAKMESLEQLAEMLIAETTQRLSKSEGRVSRREKDVADMQERFQQLVVQTREMGKRCEMQEAEVERLQSALEVAESSIDSLRKSNDKESKRMTEAMQELRTRADELVESSAQWESNYHRAKEELDREIRLHGEESLKVEALNGELTATQRRLEQLQEECDASSKDLARTLSATQQESLAIKRQYERVQQLVDETAEHWRLELETLRDQQKAVSNNLLKVREGVGRTDSELKMQQDWITETLTALQQQCLAMERKAQEQSSDYRSIRDQKARVETLYETSRENLEDTRQRLQKAENDLEQRTVQLEVVTGERDQYQQELALLQGDFGTSKHEYESLQSELRKLSDISSKQQTQLQKSREQMTKMKQELEQERACRAEADRQVVATQDALNKLQGIHETQRLEAQAVLEARDALLVEKDRLARALEASQKELNDIKELHEGQRESGSKLNQSLRTVQEELTKTREQLVSLQTAHEHLEREFDRATKQLESLRAEKFQQQESLTEYINKLHRDLTRERDEMEGQLLELANACRLFKTDLETKASLLESMETKARQDQDDLDMLQREAQEFKDQYQGQEVLLREQVDQLTQEVATLKDQTSDLLERLDAKETALASTSEQLERAQAEIQILVAGKDGLSEEDRMKRLHSVGASLNKQRKSTSATSTSTSLAGSAGAVASQKRGTTSSEEKKSP